MFKHFSLPCAIVLGIIVSASSLIAQENLTADEIIRTMTETLNPDQSEGKMKMTITTTSGEERTFVYQTYSKDGGEKSLMKYLEPSRVKGQTILMLNDGDDIWTYFPKKNHIRKLATHAKKQKLEGSDFSYEDMGGSSAFIDEYTAVRLDDEKKEGYSCYKIELIRKVDSDAGYSRLMVWVDRATLVPIVIDYYHENDHELREKQLILRNIKVIDGIPTPMQYTMYNKLDDTKTNMEIIEVRYDVDLPDNLFTEEGMKQ